MNLKQQFSMLYRLLRPHPGLVARFTVGSLGRAAMTAASILLIREFLASVLGQGRASEFNVARTIIKNAPILLLDEATSSLDSYSEARVQRAVDRLAVGRLAISVAHRLSTLRNATRILVLEQGRAVGLGTHKELLANCLTYRRLWEAQGTYTQDSIQDVDKELALEEQ